MEADPDFWLLVQESPKVIGEGVFGRVYDLGDGTVLKLGRDKCAGIGSGREKIDNEFETLTKLQAATDLVGLIAQPLGKGEIPSTTELAREGFELWLRTSKLPGRLLYAHVINGLSSTEQQAVGASVGRTLARLHAAMSRVLPSGISAGIPYQEIEQEVGNSQFYRNVIAALRVERERIPESIRARPAHNDCNLSNLLFTGHEVTGVLDFAECGNEFPEKDLSDVVSNAPVLAESLIGAYENAAGFAVNPRRLTLGLAENALYGSVIDARRGDREASEKSRLLLVRYLAELGHNIAATEEIHIRPT
jgi:hypothetical protein